MRHPSDLLASFVAGTLPDDEAADRVARHVARCRDCAAEVASWRRVAGAVRQRAGAGAAPPAGLFDAVLARLSAAGELVSTGRVARLTVPRYAATPGSAAGARAVRILVRQWRLVDRRVWPVAGAVLAVGTACAAWARPGHSGAVLAMVVPLVAALSVAGACGGGADPAAELVAASPTGMRRVLLARLTLVLGAIFGAASLASLGLAWADLGDPLRLFAAWLGPMVLLSALSFTVSVLWRPAGGVGAALALWGVRVLAGPALLDHTVADLVEPLWRTSGPVLAGAVVLVAGTLALLPSLPGRPARP
jgi:hypothetical protein